MIKKIIFNSVLSGIVTLGYINTAFADTCPHVNQLQQNESGYIIANDDYGRIWEYNNSRGLVKFDKHDIEFYGAKIYVTHSRELKGIICSYYNKKQGVFTSLFGMETSEGTFENPTPIDMSRWKDDSSGGNILYVCPMNIISPARDPQNCSFKDLSSVGY